MQMFTCLLLVFLFPVFTNAEEVKLTCDKLEVKKDEEINCQIVASGVEYVTTSVVGQITIDDNMELISSEYDEENWKILDQEFSVRSINLMSENLEGIYHINDFFYKQVNDEMRPAGYIMEFLPKADMKTFRMGGA